MTLVPTRLRAVRAWPGTGAPLTTGAFISAVIVSSKAVIRPMRSGHIGGGSFVIAMTDADQRM
jgi:hypothetical protein